MQQSLRGLVVGKVMLREKDADDDGVHGRHEDPGQIVEARRPDLPARVGLHLVPIKEVIRIAGAEARSSGHPSALLRFSVGRALQLDLVGLLQGQERESVREKQVRSQHAEEVRDDCEREDSPARDLKSS